MQIALMTGSCQKRPENGEDEAENPVFTAEDYLNSEIEYGTMIDPRDSSVYKTVKIGDKVWMAQNLGYGDDSIRAYGNATNFDSLNGHNYYANEAQLVCPEGWHLPRYNELRYQGFEVWHGCCIYSRRICLLLVFFWI